MSERKPSQLSDHQLGMDRVNPRRDFLNGAAMAIGATATPPLFQRKRHKLQFPVTLNLQHDRPARRHGLQRSA
jgi:hypothetical protein